MTQLMSLLKRVFSNDRKNMRSSFPALKDPGDEVADPVLDELLEQLILEEGRQARLKDEERPVLSVDDILEGDGFTMS